MVQVVVEDLSVRREIENASEMRSPHRQREAARRPDDEESGRSPVAKCRNEVRTGNIASSFEWCFGLLGIFLRRPMRWQRLYKRVATMVLILCCLRASYQIWRSVGLFAGAVASPTFRRVRKTSTRVARLPLLVLEYAAHIYLCYDLWRNEKLIGHLYRGIRGERLRRRPRLLPATLTISFGLIVSIAGVKMVRFYIYPEHWTLYKWHLYLAMTPLRLLWSVSVIFYFVIALDLIDQVASLSERIRAASPHGRLDLVQICHQAFEHKKNIRQRVWGVNRVFSKMLLFQYGKILLYALNIFFYALKTGALRPLEMFHSGASLVFFSTEVALLSWAGTRFQTGLRDSVDSFVKLVLDAEPEDIRMVGQIRRILSFDAPRDALTIWDSFILARATVVTFLGGIISFVAIILQFDSDFMNALKD